MKGHFRAASELVIPRSEIQCAFAFYPDTQCITGGGKRGGERFIAVHGQLEVVVGAGIVAAPPGEIASGVGEDVNFRIPAIQIGKHARARQYRSVAFTCLGQSQGPISGNKFRRDDSILIHHHTLLGAGGKCIWGKIARPLRKGITAIQQMRIYAGLRSVHVAIDTRNRIRVSVAGGLHGQGPVHRDKYGGNAAILIHQEVYLGLSWINLSDIAFPMAEGGAWILHGCNALDKTIC